MFVNQLCFLFVVCLWMSFAHLSVGIFPDYLMNLQKLIMH